MTAPIKYLPDWMSQDAASVAFTALWSELAWVHVPGRPRREYYVAKTGLPYTYGSGPGRTTYESQPMHPWIEKIWHALELQTPTKFDVCFLNGYKDGRDHLGWHADDSPEMDDARPIAIVSLGAEREIWFRPNEARVERLVASDPAMLEDHATASAPHNLGLLYEKHRAVEKLLLQHGSLCLMRPGMQDTHQHRIPKSDRQNCGPRISFTFRGYAP
jgi:alkylated DNA repair dioxygenase AlkB